MAKSKTTISKSPNIILRKKKNNKVYSLFLDIHFNGKRTKEYLKLYLTGDKEIDRETLHLAERIKAKRILELQALQHDEQDYTKLKADFLQYFETKSKSKRKAWKTTLKHLNDFNYNPVPFRNITPQWVENFKKYLLEKCSVNSAACYYDTLKACFNLAVKEGMINQNPCKKVDSITKKKVERTFLTFEEIKKLDQTDCKDNRVKRAFLFACFTGLRYSDIDKLTWNQIQGNFLHFTQSKTGNPEIMPLSEQALKYLGEKGSPEESVFNLLGDTWVSNILKKWIIKAEISKNVTFHTSRHTFATLALTYGVDIYTVSKLLGHTELKNTQIYAKIVDKKKQEAVNMLPEF